MEEEKQNSRQLLLAASLRADGDYYKTLDILHGLDLPDDDEVKEAENKINCKYVTYLDADYPKALKATRFPPIVLYYYGDLSLVNHEGHALAVVGSRVTSEYGANVTARFVKDLCQDYVIVSGLAKGIDAIAHRETIENKGKTIAVLGSGIDNCYPCENLALYKEIKEKGLVISEYPNMATPDANHFPMRNRIISALSRGTLVTEAGIRSGTLITVNWSLTLSKSVMAIPYPIGRESGCNQLIKEGAFLVESPDEVRYFMQGLDELKNH